LDQRKQHTKALAFEGRNASSRFKERQQAGEGSGMQGSDNVGIWSLTKCPLRRNSCRISGKDMMIRLRF
jgi:hypothetical protein